MKSRCFLLIFIILVFILDFRLVRKLVFLYFNVNVYLKEIPCLNKNTLPYLTLSTRRKTSINIILKCDLQRPCTDIFPEVVFPLKFEVSRKETFCLSKETNILTRFRIKWKFFFSPTLKKKVVLYGSRNTAGPVARVSVGVLTYYVPTIRRTLAVMWSVPFDLNLY